MGTLRSKILAVEGVRGIACLMVFLSHLSSTFFPSMHTGNPNGVKSNLELLLHHSPFAFIYSGAAAVGIFFVLSGFILGYALSEKGDVVENCTAMFVKRYFRLMPVALFSSILAFLIFKFTNVNTGELASWAKNYYIQFPSFFDSIYHGALTPFLSGSAPYNWSLWTMKIELIGSMIVCLLSCILIGVKYKKTILLICMMIPFFMNIKKGDDVYFASFISGLLIYHFRYNFNKYALGIIFIIGLYLCGFHPSSRSYFWFNKIIHIKIDGQLIDNYILFNNIGGFLVVLLAVKSELIGRIFSVRPLTFMGKLSFSVYAIHQPIMHFTCPLLFNFLVLKDINYENSALISSVVTMVVVYISAIPTYKYIDKYSVNLSNIVQKKVMYRN